MKLGILMDPIQSIHYKKDSTLAMLWEAQDRGWSIDYMEQKDLFLRDGKAFTHSAPLKVFKNAEHWFECGEKSIKSLAELDVILMRKDPPFNLAYIYTTYILEQAEREGVKVFNKPQSLRDFNEKLITTLFPQCCPPTLVTHSKKQLRDFYQEHQDIICKPLEGMGGASVFRLKYPDQNASVIFETLTQQENHLVMAQRFIPEITLGDKRILMVHGEPIPFALARIPAEGELRGNLAAGGKGIAQPLSKRDLWICEQVGRFLKEKGIIFAGLDVIGDYLTEINITSPTCIRELDEQCHLNISAQLLNAF